MSAQGEQCPQCWRLFALNCNINCPRLGAPASSRSHGASGAHSGIKTDKTDATTRSTEPEGWPSPADPSEAPSPQPVTTLLDSGLTVPLTVLCRWPQVSVLQTRGCVSLRIFELHVLHPETGLHCEGQLPRLLSGVL